MSNMKIISDNGMPAMHPLNVRKMPSVPSIVDQVCVCKLVIYFIIGCVSERGARSYC